MTWVFKKAHYCRNNSFKFKAFWIITYKDLVSVLFAAWRSWKKTNCLVSLLNVRDDNNGPTSKNKPASQEVDNNKVISKKSKQTHALLLPAAKLNLCNTSSGLKWGRSQTYWSQNPHCFPVLSWGRPAVCCCRAAVWSENRALKGSCHKPAPCVQSHPC